MSKTLFGIPLTAAGSARLAPWRARWQALDARERRVLHVGAALLGLLLLWTLAVAPAWRTLRQAPAQLAELDTQLQHSRRLAQEARLLREQPAVPPAQALLALKAASEHLGSSGRLSVSGERAVMTLSGVDQQALQTWLGEVRSAARARPVEVNLQRGPQGYAGTIVLALGAGAP
jgi:general secretion pathway protein M